jgi:hypothetical protein
MVNIKMRLKLAYIERESFHSNMPRVKSALFARNNQGAQYLFYRGGARRKVLAPCELASFSHMFGRRNGTSKHKRNGVDAPRINSVAQNYQERLKSLTVYFGHKLILFAINICKLLVLKT